MRLGEQYGRERLEAACKRALAVDSINYKSIASILKHGLDRRPLPEKQPQLPSIEHVNIRGPQYYYSENQTYERREKYYA